ncbi:MAG TPA: hypothetical protein VGJ12_09670 [Gemmatimonadaceae bacterium]
MQSNRIAVVVVLSALLLGSGAIAVGAQVPSDPCTQVSAAQVSTALGETVSAGVHGPPPTCTWQANVPTHQIVTLMFSPPGDWDTRKTAEHPGITKAAVGGVGDDALAMSMGPLTSLFVKKGSVTFMVRVYGVPDPAKQLAIEKPIAQTVAGHLTS